MWFYTKPIAEQGLLSLLALQGGGVVFGTSNEELVGETAQ